MAELDINTRIADQMEAVRELLHLCRVFTPNASPETLKGMIFDAMFSIGAKPISTETPELIAEIFDQEGIK